MKKTDAVRLFGKVKDLAEALGVTSSAVSQWPEQLPVRLADQVRGAAARLGRSMPGPEEHQHAPPPSTDVVIGRTADGAVVVSEAQ
jgi:transcriptional regulator with XRE-family HTH domain